MEVETEAARGKMCLEDSRRRVERRGVPQGSLQGAKSSAPLYSGNSAYPGQEESVGMDLDENLGSERGHHPFPQPRSAAHKEHLVQALKDKMAEELRRYKQQLRNRSEGPYVFPCCE